MPRLSVNVDHVATVRQARRDKEPDPVAAAYMAELAGADGITVHLREDRRHICDRDVEVIRKTCKTVMNLEMAATPEMVEIALRVKPDMVSLVPEKREELTTEGGLDVISVEATLTESVAKLKAGGIKVNLFVDAAPEVMKASKRIGADGVELHTGTYANATSEGEREKELEKLKKNATLASELGLKVHAGHGLDYRNVQAVREIPEIEEFAIGFSIIARSVYVGIDMAVREMADLVK